ncbi:solute carrier family 25 member 40 isoform X2 [Coturnix japonica]|uniref:solute carrier family 25 member 40 isoform X2 n=1 Tax=Coturnix japonica TaxID=93934 RepID=UPI000776DFD2|nr:solute carrier family 25 member 40 isoform X2 [Coturnix japonica]
MLLSPLLQQKVRFFLSEEKVMDEMSNSDFSKTTSFQHAVSSCCGAIVTSLFVTPLDVVKTRLQAQSSPSPKGKCLVYSNGQVHHTHVCENGDGKVFYNRNRHFKGMLDAFVKIIQIEGIKSLWSGLSPTLIMALPTSVIYFTCYEKLREALRFRLGEDNDHIPIVASSLSRFVSVTAVSPVELIKTRMQYHTLSYKQLQLSIRSTVARDGWLFLWRGWSSTVLRDVPFSAVYWYNYERFKKMMCKNGGAHEPTFFIAFTAGAASGSIAAVVTLPFDVVKTHRQTEIWESETLQNPQRDSASTWAVMRKIVAKKGIAGLFAGFTPRLFKVTPSCAIMISTYEYGKAFFRHLNEKTNQHS